MNPFFTGKHKPLDAPLFRAFVVSLGCALMGGECSGGCDPHHWPSSSLGGSDVLTIPLCRFHHDEAERGWQLFVSKYSLNVEDIHRRIWDSWLLATEHGAPPIPTPQKKQRARGKNLAKLTKTCNDRL